jgi:glycosyltransferase involved in cell wall biosynthesis
MPVYNGALHIERALETLLAQRLRDFELVISDDCSTDDTPRICEAFAGRDSRVRFVRAPANGGACWNFNRVLELAKGALFAWAAQDDEWHPDFLERCVGVLDQRESAVACCGQYELIDARGHACSAPLGVGCEGTLRRERWKFVLRHEEVHPALYAVMRTPVLRRTRGYLPFISSDFVLISEVVLHGELIVVPEVLHRKRLHSGISPEGTYRRKDIIRHLDPKARGPHLFYRYNLLHEELAGLRHARLPLHTERVLAYDAWKHFFVSRNWLRDGIDVAKDLTGIKRETPVSLRSLLDRWRAKGR